jgi:hypothetical protein
MVKLLLGFFLVVAAIMVMGQGQITIVQDPRIELLTNKQIEQNMSLRRVQGYRIQLKSSTDRNEVMQIKLQFLQSYPNVKTYLTYQQPYFKLRVGDFVSNSEANSFMHDINAMFKGIFIVPDIVNAVPEGLISDDTKKDKKE